MKSKSTKIQELADLKAKIPDAKITVFTGFSKAGEKGLSVAQATELRRLLRAMNADYVVTKKTIINRAFEAEGLDLFSMDGSVGLVVGKDDPYAVSKKIYEFAKKNQALRFFGAMIDGAFIGADAFIEMAKLPSRDQLIARLLGMMMYPVTSLAIVINEISKTKEVKV